LAPGRGKDVNEERAIKATWRQPVCGLSERIDSGERILARITRARKEGGQPPVKRWGSSKA